MVRLALVRLSGRPRRWTQATARLLLHHRGFSSTQSRVGKKGSCLDGNRVTQCLSGGQSTVGPKERVIFLTDRSDFAQLLKDEGCMTHSMTHAADPLAQLEGRERIGGGGEVTRYKLFLPLF